MKVFILLAVLVISINGFNYSRISDQKNLRNFQQFVIHYISPVSFVTNYGEWAIITQTGHDIMGSAFDDLFDRLSLASESKIQLAVNILSDLLHEVSEMELDHETDYHTVVQNAINKIKALLV